MRLATALSLSVVVVACSSEQQPVPQSYRSQSSAGNAVSPVPQSYRIQLSAGDAVSAVCDASKRDEIVLLELYSDKIVFTALVSRRKYEEVFSFKPPTYFDHDGLEYVQNNLLFWGAPGKAEQVSVDGEMFDGFVLAAGKTQIIAEGEHARAVVKATRSGSRLKLEKSYWNDVDEKAFPSCDLSAIRDRLPALSSSSTSGFTVSESETRCKSYGPREVVWLENKVGIFALNGPAIALVESGTNDVPWTRNGLPVELGRDVLGAATDPLIQAGLRKCK